MHRAELTGKAIGLGGTIISGNAQISPLDPDEQPALQVPFRGCVTRFALGISKVVWASVQAGIIPAPRRRSLAPHHHYHHVFLCYRLYRLAVRLPSAHWTTPREYGKGGLR